MSPPRPQPAGGAPAAAPPADARGEHDCASCGRRMTPRKRWQRDFAQVRYCSRACRARGVRPVDAALEQAIVDLLARRARGATIGPSEAARAVAAHGDWRVLMEPARRAARRLVHHGRVEIVQRGRVVDPSAFRGPVRVRARD